MRFDAWLVGTLAHYLDGESVETSVYGDHGTGYDIAGKGLASERSLREACFLAIDIVRRRVQNELLAANALKIDGAASSR